MECPSVTLQKLYNDLLKDYIKAGDVIQRLISEIYTSQSEEDIKILKLFEYNTIFHIFIFHIIITQVNIS